MLAGRLYVSPAVAQAALLPAAPGTAETIGVLVVDDNEVVRLMTRQVFRNLDGFEVVGEASDGREAVELAAKLLPDVILMDLEMPAMDGAAATRDRPLVPGALAGLPAGVGLRDLGGDPLLRGLARDARHRRLALVLRPLPPGALSGGLHLDDRHRARDGADPPAGGDGRRGGPGLSRQPSTG